jgi:ribonuclease P protein component
VKRLLREITRLTAIEPGWDIVFIARPAAATTDFTVLKNSVLNLLSRARILENKPASS